MARSPIANCTNCGDTLTAANRSKSWRSRCKPCVNAWFADYREMRREVRDVPRHAL